MNAAHPPGGVRVEMKQRLIGLAFAVLIAVVMTAPAYGGGGGGGGGGGHGGGGHGGGRGGGHHGGHHFHHFHHGRVFVGAGPFVAYPYWLGYPGTSYDSPAVS